jgi:hypothetical protein
MKLQMTVRILSAAIAAIFGSSAFGRLAWGAQETVPADADARVELVSRIRRVIASGEALPVARALREAVHADLREVADELPTVLRWLVTVNPKGGAGKLTRDERQALDFAVAWALVAAIQFGIEASDSELHTLRWGVSEDALLITESITLVLGLARGWEEWLDRAVATARLAENARVDLPPLLSVRVFDQRVAPSQPLPDFERLSR